MSGNKYHWADGPNAAVVEPSENRKARGYVKDETPASEHFNWILRELFKGVNFEFTTSEELIASGRQRGYVSPATSSTWDRVWSVEGADTYRSMTTDGEYLWVVRNDADITTVIVEKLSRVDGSVLATLNLPGIGGMFQPYVHLATVGGNVYLSVKVGTEWRIRVYDRDLLELYTWEGNNAEVNVAGEIYGIATDGRYIAELRESSTSGTDLILYEDDGETITYKSISERIAGNSTYNKVKMDGGRIATGGKASTVDGAHVLMLKYSDVLESTVWKYEKDINVDVEDLVLYRGLVLISDSNATGGHENVALLYPGPPLTAGCLQKMWSITGTPTYGIAADKLGVYTAQKSGDVSDLGDIAVRSWHDGSPFMWYPKHGASLSMLSGDNDAIFSYGTSVGDIRLRRLSGNGISRLLCVHAVTDAYRSLPSILEVD